MFVGIVFLSLLTASIASRFVKEERSEERDDMMDALRRIEADFRNVARAVEEAAAAAGIDRATPHDLRRSFCSLAGRRGVDPIEAAQITGHSPAVWARFYARSFGKAQRDEARRRMLEHGFGDVR
jgi:integrase